MSVKIQVVLLLLTISTFCDSITHSVSYELRLGEIRESVLFYCGLPTHPTPGEPQMPYKKYRFLLPSDISPNSIKVSLQKLQQEQVLSQTALAPAAPYISDSVLYTGSDETFIHGKKPSIYQENCFFPQSNILNSRFFRKREFNILEVTLFPYRYNPVTREVVGLSSADIVISFNRNSERRSLHTIPPSFLKTLKKEIVNFDEMISHYTNQAPVCRNSNYHIITTEAIKESLSMLDAFIKQKQNRGFTVTVVTETQWGGGSGNQAADNLREWLEEHYLTDNIEYVLLIGNPSPSDGNMAMKIAYAYYSGKTAPTDFYFSELSGNWDADGDGKFGETDDLNTKKADGIDAEADVLLGRIPYYSGDAAKVDAILEKTILYESEKQNETSWRNNILLAMDGYYGSEGPDVGETIFSELPSQWNAYRIYCSNKGNPDKSQTSMTNVTNAWAPGKFGVVSWLTHGKADAAMHIMDINYAKQLSNEYPSIVMMGSCLNGKPDVPYNLAYTVLQQGGIAVVAGSETTIYKQPMGNFIGSSYNHGFIHSFSTKISKDRELVVDALNRTRNESDMGCWKNYCAFNLYGDPTIGIDVSGITVDLSNSATTQSKLKANVVNNRINLTNLGNGPNLLSLYNTRGQKIFRKEFFNCSTIDLCTEDIATGIYTLQIKSSGNHLTQQVFIK